MTDEVGSGGTVLEKDGRHSHDTVATCGRKACAVDPARAGAPKRPRPAMRLGLGAKFTLTVLAILAATMAANTLYFLGTSTRFHERQLEERGRALGHLIALVSP